MKLAMNKWLEKISSTKVIDTFQFKGGETPEIWTTRFPHAIPETIHIVGRLPTPTGSLGTTHLGYCEQGDSGWKLTINSDAYAFYMIIPQTFATPKEAVDFLFEKIILLMKDHFYSPLEQLANSIES